jgi:uncharacterized protein YwqG
MSVRASVEFVQVSQPIVTPTSKFGGQPVWLNAPQWPLSRSTGNPMRFICQLALDAAVFPGCAASMAYIFMTEEDEHVEDTWEPDGGENAVILQPGPAPTGIQCVAHATGPTLYTMLKVRGKKLLQPVSQEFAVALSALQDETFQPESIREGWGNDQFEAYASTLAGNKLGGAPVFIQSDQFPTGIGWRLLLQLDSTAVPFYVNFGSAGIAYVFLNADGTSGKMLWQC